MFVLKKAEFFIAIAKQNEHSFMMLGFTDNDGTHRLLARVGKTHYIDPDAESQIRLTIKCIRSKALAHVADEGIKRSDDHLVSINYQAYSISFDQVEEFLHLIADIEQRQLANPDINARTRERIDAYVPVSHLGSIVTFSYKPLSKWHKPAHQQNDNQHLAEEASAITLTNTCRTTALNMVEAILGFATHISKYFFIAPKYETTLEAGLPNKDSFYVLPIPPNAYDNVSNSQKMVLESLYTRIEQIPASRSKSCPQSRAKFNALKKLYNDLAGTNQCTANELLMRVVKYEEQHGAVLHRHREANFFQRLFSLASNTQKTFRTMKQELYNQPNEGAAEQANDTIPPALGR